MKTCCCCCTTQVGSLVIGVLSLIGSFCYIIYSINGYVQTKAEHNPDIQENVESKQELFIASMVIASVSLVVNLLLVIGVEKKRKCLMIPWIILSFIGNSLITLGAFLCIIFIFIAGREAAVMWILFIIVVLYCALSWYFTMCVWSHYKEIGDEETRITAELPDTHEMDNNTVV